MTKADMDKMMAQMMELAKPGENHKLLAGLGRHVELHRQDVDEPRPNGQAGRVKGHSHP